MIAVVPVTLTEARRWAWPPGESKHRHHRGPRVTDRFAIGVERDGELVAVALAGLPAAAAFGARCVEVTRVVSVANIEENACSRLYSACARAWLAMGGVDS